MKYRNIIAKTIVSFGGVGYIKPLSATWGSLASGIALYFFWSTVDLQIKALAIIGVFILGWYLAERITKNSKLHDPHFIVIDEVVGMMIVTILLDQIWWQWILAFILFRIFDIAKLWPASFFDKKSGGFAIMFDDVIMALPALLVLQLVLVLL